MAGLKHPTKASRITLVRLLGATLSVPRTPLGERTISMGPGFGALDGCAYSAQILVLPELDLCTSPIFPAPGQQIRD